MGDQHVTLRPLSNQRKLRYPMSTMKSSLSIGCMMGLVWFGVGMTVHAASVSDFPSCPFPDTEVSTNVVLSVGNENTRVFSLTLELDASVSNGVEVAFGCDRNADGELNRLETDALVGWDAGAWFYRDRRDGSGNACARSDGHRTLLWNLALTPTLRAKELVATDGDSPVFPRQVPATLFDPSWNLMRVTVRGLEPSAALVVTQTRVHGFTVRLR